MTRKYDNTQTVKMSREAIANYVPVKQSKLASILKTAGFATTMGLVGFFGGGCGDSNVYEAKNVPLQKYTTQGADQGTYRYIFEISKTKEGETIIDPEGSLDNTKLKIGENYDVRYMNNYFGNKYLVSVEPSKKIK